MKVSARIAGLYAELKRRKVVRTAIAYGVAGFTIIQVTDPVAHGLHLPDDTLTYVIYALAVGFPLALILAWLFEINREVPAEEVAADSATRSADQLDAETQTSRKYTCDAPLTPLVGRESEVATALQLLDDHSCRVLTITGPGGIGKTRLAQEIAARSNGRFKHGVCFVSLVSVESVESIPAALADALGLGLSARENSLRQLAGFLHEKELLLVLDNFEHIVEGAGIVSDLVLRAKRLCVVTTSRRRLRIAGESVLPLEALSLPAENAALSESEAARLFLQIARRSDPRFVPNAETDAAIARICHMTDGIPLAIELAASSVGVLSCAEIVRELEQSHDLVVGGRRDVPAKHQTLHAAFESSWRLLQPEEQRAFAGLCTFRSRFQPGDAEAVVQTHLQLLARLVDVSLVRRPPGGEFEILHVLRQFGEEKLDANPHNAADVRRRHTQHFLSQLSELGDRPEGPARESAAERLAPRIAEIRTAWNRAAAEGAYDALRRSARGMFSFLEMRGRTAEGAELFGRAVTAVRPIAAREGGAAAAALARLLSREAAFVIDIGHVSEAADLLAESLLMLRAEGDEAEVAFALSKQCTIARMNGDFSSPVFEETLALSRKLNDLPAVARALNLLGSARQALGRYDEARQLYQESVQLFRRIGLGGEAWLGLNNLAGIAHLEGDTAGARRILEEELSAARTRKNPRTLSFLLGNLAFITSTTGDLASARALLAESIALAREMGYRGRLAYSLNTLGGVYLRNHELESAAQAYRDALATALDAEQAPLVPSILIGVARLHIARGEPGRAAAILKAVQSHPSCDEQTRRHAASVLDTIDPGLIENGETMPLEEAVHAVLEQEGQAIPA